MAKVLCKGSFRLAEQLAEQSGYNAEAAVKIWLNDDRHYKGTPASEELPPHNVAILDVIERGERTAEQNGKNKSATVERLLLKHLAENYQAVKPRNGGDSVTIIPLQGAKRAARKIDGEVAELLTASNHKAIPLSELNVLRNSFTTIQSGLIPTVDIASRCFTEANGDLLIDIGSSERDEVYRVSPKGWETTDSYDVVWETRIGDIPSPSRDALGAERFWKHFIAGLDGPSGVGLLRGWLMAAWMQNEPCPGLSISGAAGAGKSNLADAMSFLADGSRERLAPKLVENESDFTLAAKHRRVLYPDNLSGLSKSVNDLIAAMITGMDTSKRELYTNDSEVKFRVKPALIFTGIDIYGMRPDVITRLVPIELPSNLDGAVTESSLLASLAPLYSAVIAETLDNLSGFLAWKVANPGAKTEHRMGSYVQILRFLDAKYGQTGEESSADLFLSLQNIQQKSVIESNLTALEVINHIREVKAWEGTSTEMLQILRERERSIKQSDWHSSFEAPKSAAGMGRLLKELTNHIGSYGVSSKTRKLNGITHYFFEDSSDAVEVAA
jgi:hypothetical protein